MIRFGFLVGTRFAFSEVNRAAMAFPADTATTSVNANTGVFFVHVLHVQGLEDSLPLAGVSLDNVLHLVRHDPRFWQLHSDHNTSRRVPEILWHTIMTVSYTHLTLPTKA